MTYAGSIDSRELFRASVAPDMRISFPTKLYIFGTALKDRKTSDSIFQDSTEIKQCLSYILDHNQEITKWPHLYAIAAAWGYIKYVGKNKKPVKAIDIFSYNFDQSWDNCNPDVDNWVFKNGVFTPMERTVTCGTTTIILGEEEKLRRRTRNFEKYLNSWPDIGDLILK